MTTRTELVRKLRAMGRSPFAPEAATALEMARRLELKTAKSVAQDIAALLRGHGLRVKVRPRNSRAAPDHKRLDVEIRYFTSRSIFPMRWDMQITVTSNEHIQRPPRK